MFAILALLCFVVALFGGTLGGLDLTLLGLAFMAAALLTSWPLAYVTTRFGGRA
jgi:hypothetical protein